MIRRFNEQYCRGLGQQLKQVIGVVYLITATSDTNRQIEADGLFGEVFITDFHE
jgi:NADPH2:quinone reductase